MARLLGIALCVCALGLIASTLVGRAFDHEAQQHVVFTRHGVTLDCVRQVSPSGDVDYNGCTRVP